LTAQQRIAFSVGDPETSISPPPYKKKRKSMAEFDAIEATTSIISKVKDQRGPR
jgi:hypothetical protein